MQMEEGLSLIVHPFRLINQNILYSPIGVPPVTAERALNHLYCELQQASVSLSLQEDVRNFLKNDPTLQLAQQVGLNSPSSHFCW